MLVSACDSNGAPVASTIVVGATVYDGTGAAGERLEVRFAGDRIIEVGDLSPVEGETVIDADGLILAPGFIDTHAHFYDYRGEYRLMPAVLSQGVTTTVTAMDGFSLADEDLDFIPVSRLVEAFEDSPSAVNVAAYSAHNSIRQHVMGSDNRRPATAAELAAMVELVRADMQAGALGLSTGLEYEPGIFSTTEEVIELARVAADFGGSYASHIRDEDDLMIDALDELIRIGREAGLPVHVSHIKLADRALWGTTESILNLLDTSRDEGIDVTADIYPYERWASNLGILFPDRDFTNREAAEFTFQHTASPDDILLTHFAPDPALEGLTIAQIAKNSGKDTVSMLLELALAADEYFREHERWGAMIIAKGMNEADVSKFMQWPYTNICTDGGYYIDHPRSYGSFPRVFSRFVGELETLSIAEAVYKMTGLSARALGLTDRGFLEPGMHADLVLLDPESITDRATMANPHAPSAGIEKVWVNGELAFANGEPTERFAGRIVTHGKRQSARPSG
ncbi:MAG: N-acyl-D-amino-acid deacylase family protein [Woeseiaceae bacterium]